MTHSNSVHYYPDHGLGVNKSAEAAARTARELSNWPTRLDLNVSKVNAWGSLRTIVHCLIHHPPSDSGFYSKYAFATPGLNMRPSGWPLTEQGSAYICLPAPLVEKAAFDEFGFQVMTLSAPIDQPRFGEPFAAGLIASA